MTQCSDGRVHVHHCTVSRCGYTGNDLSEETTPIEAGLVWTTPIEAGLVWTTPIEAGLVWTTPNYKVTVASLQFVSSTIFFSTLDNIIHWFV